MCLQNASFLLSSPPIYWLVLLSQNGLCLTASLRLISLSVDSRLPSSVLPCLRLLGLLLIWLAACLGLGFYSVWSSHTYTRPHTFAKCSYEKAKSKTKNPAWLEKTMWKLKKKTVLVGVAEVVHSKDLAFSRRGGFLAMYTLFLAHAASCRIVSRKWRERERVLSTCCHPYAFSLMRYSFFIVLFFSWPAIWMSLTRSRREHPSENGGVQPRSCNLLLLVNRLGKCSSVRLSECFLWTLSSSFVRWSVQFSFSLSKLSLLKKNNRLCSLYNKCVCIYLAWWESREKNHLSNAEARFLCVYPCVSLLMLLAVSCFLYSQTFWQFPFCKYQNER